MILPESSQGGLAPFETEKLTLPRLRAVILGLMIASMPRWDLTPFFPQIDSPEFVAACSDLDRRLAGLETRFDENKIGLGAKSKADDPLVDTILHEINLAGSALNLIKAYVGVQVSTDSNDDAALAADSETDSLLVRFNKLMTRLYAWAGQLTGPNGQVAEEHRFFLTKAQILSRHLMSPAEESLAADFATCGWMAWSKLHGNMGSQILVDVPLPTGLETLPMSAVRSLAYDADAQVREAAHDAELAAWKKVEMPMAACLNGVKGEVSTLARRRGWSSALEASLFENSIDRETLDAMMGAAEESFPIFRRYMKAKAKALGKSQLAFFDIFAPVGKEAKSWTVEEAEEFVEDNFRLYSDKLADFAVRAFRERWVDYESRPGKRDGAFCAPFRGEESRILTNFKPSYKSVGTLAHELGHGYHGLCLSKRTFLQRETPSTLAETASIFCETIMKNAALAQGTAEENLAILEATVGGACQVVVDISSRFRFESAVFDGRANRDLSPAELCEAMLQAQRETYGDGLDGDKLHPYMWAAKPHYYDAGSFYNYPYMFGLLFGLGLYAIYESEPQGFHARYDELLSMTGMDDAATLAARFGIDTRKPDFWRASLQVVERDIERFEKLVGA